jgi:large subunit ribosomal protein L4
MNKKQRRKAIFMALSDRASDNQILAVDNFVSDGSKTKDVSSMIEALPCGRDVLIVVDRESESLKRASANISNAKTILVDYLNVCDLLKYETVLFVKEALESVETIFTSKVTK